MRTLVNRAGPAAVALWLAFLHLHFLWHSTWWPREPHINGLLVDLQLENPYQLLKGKSPSLCIDVGGHVGWTASTMAAAVPINNQLQTQ